MRTRATVAGLTSTATAIAASVQPGPASPWVALSRMRAWVNALAGATPRPIMVCSRARSASDRTTMCRLRTSASCGGGIPRPHEHETEPHISQVTTDDLLRPAGIACRVDGAAGLGRAGVGRPPAGHRPAVTPGARHQLRRCGMTGSALLGTHPYGRL